MKIMQSKKRMQDMLKSLIIAYAIFRIMNIIFDEFNRGRKKRIKYLDELLKLGIKKKHKRKIIKDITFSTLITACILRKILEEFEWKVGKGCYPK